MAMAFRSSWRIPLGDVCRVGARKNFYRVVTSRAQLEDLWSYLWQPGPLPKVDFDREVLLGVFLGECATGGYDIRIHRISKRRGQLIVHIKIQRPRPQDLVTMVVTYPGHIVSIPRETLVGVKTVIFQNQNRELLAEVPLCK